MLFMPYKEYGREYLDRFGGHDKKDCSTPVSKKAQGSRGATVRGNKGAGVLSLTMPASLAPEYSLRSARGTDRRYTPKRP